MKHLITYEEVLVNERIDWSGIPLVICEIIELAKIIKGEGTPNSKYPAEKATNRQVR